MVDVDVEIPRVVAKGKLLTLTTAEALQHKVAERQADTLERALAAAGLPDADRESRRGAGADASHSLVIERQSSMQSHGRSTASPTFDA
jgi:membrane-bound serine protease (ClpP class)